MSEPAPRRRPWPAIALTTIGSLLCAVAVAIIGALVLALLFWQLIANIVMVAFKQALHWYGPSVYTAGGDLWWFVLGIGAVGAALLTGGISLLTKAGASLPGPLQRRPR